MSNENEALNDDEMLLDPKPINFEEPHFYEDLKNNAFKTLLGLGALVTIFPLIANKLNSTLGIPLQCAFHVVYSVYFLLPAFIIFVWCKRKKVRQHLIDQANQKKSIVFIYINLAIALLSGLLYFGFGVSSKIFYIPLFFGVFLSFLYQIILNTRIFQTETKEIRGRRIAFNFATIFLLVLIVGGFLIHNKDNPVFLQRNVVNKDSKKDVRWVYSELEEHKIFWNNVESELNKLRFLATRQALNHQNKIIDSTKSKENKQCPLFKFGEKIKNIEEKIPVDDKFGESAKLSQFTFKKLEVVVGTAKAIEQEINRKNLKRALDIIFFSGTFFFLFILLILINLLLFYRFKQIDSQNPTECCEKEIKTIKNFIVLIVLLTIPIFHTIDSKNVDLDQPIWPMNLRYIITGGIYSPSSNFTDNSIHIEEKSDLEKILATLMEIECSTYEINDNVLENTSELEMLNQKAEEIIVNTKDIAKKVNVNIEKTDEVRNK